MEICIVVSPFSESGFSKVDMFKMTPENANMQQKHH